MSSFVLYRRIVFSLTSSNTISALFVQGFPNSLSRMRLCKQDGGAQMMIRKQDLKRMI